MYQIWRLRVKKRRSKASGVVRYAYGHLQKVLGKKYNRSVYEAAATGVGARCVLWVAKSDSLVGASSTVSRLFLVLFSG